MPITPSIHTDFRLQGKAFSNPTECLDFARTLSREAAIFLTDWFDDKDYVLVQTSGSTGSPKQIRLTKQHMRNSAQATADFFGLLPGTTALLCLSPGYIAGKMMLVRALVLGWHLDLVPPVSTPLAGHHKKYDFAAMVPLQLGHSLSAVYRIRTLIVGGGAVSTTLLKALRGLSTRVFETYGMTETITHIAVKRLNPSEESTLDKFPAFRVLPGITLEIDRRNCLVINAPEVSETPVVTNDLVSLLSDQEFQWLGRFDSLVNSGGIKLIPEQIEAKLASAIQGRFFLAGLPDALLGEKLVLLLEAQTMEEESLQRIYRESGLSRYEIPKTCYTLAHFVSTPTQKIDRSRTLALLPKRNSKQSKK
ncbi:MAG: AMP-binding protein [Lutibacter sp.]|jgi:O-succinylbenzoic acid--CoA ligase|nr:AMP-binding protein [Lutibacter sp.]